MKTLLKLVVALALLNAVARAGSAAWDYYQLRDTAQQLVTFGGNFSEEQIRASIVASAAERGLPLGPDAVRVRRDGLRTIAEASYTQHIEFFPRYEAPIEFSFSVDAMSMSGLK